MSYSSRAIENKRLRAERMAAARRMGTHTKEQWAALRDVFGCCVRCGSDAYHLERDHIVPVYQGGCDCIGNIQPMCARCNAAKGPENEDLRCTARPDWARHFTDQLVLGRPA